MKNAPTISLFFPAYNEEENIADSIRAADRVLRRVARDYEIIVVNDGSRDKTAAVAERESKNNPRVRLLNHAANSGYGSALVSGFRAARFEYVFFTDADLQFDINELVRLVAYIPRYDAVIGYRAPRRDPFMRLANAWGWNALNRLLFGLRVRDIDCAFKLFRRDLIDGLPIKSKGAMISAEILIRLSRQGVVFKEVPVTHLPRTRGSATGAKLSVIARAFGEMMTLYETELGNRTLIEFIKFGLVGLVNTGIDLAAYFTLTRGTEFFGSAPVFAKAVSFTLGTFSSFALNRTWTFKLGREVGVRDYVFFYLVALSSLGINVFSTYALLRYAHFYDLVAVISATVLTFFWNFTLTKTLVFTDRLAKPLEEPAAS